MQAIMETIFDAVYLSLVITLGVIMIKKSRGQGQYFLFGIMAVTLGAGDAFHLVPRALALCTTGLDQYVVALGVGKLITSITMTVFYLLLYFVWRLRYNIVGHQGLNGLMFGLAALRVALCLFPQNGWTSANPSLLWGVLRNVPFALMGALVIVLFWRSSRESKDRAFWNMGLSILLSFAFYIPVVLFSETIPSVGILMIPKTCAYVWSVLIGYQSMKQQAK